MSVKTGRFNGHLIVDNKLNYHRKSIANNPFCHFCRKKVSAIHILERTGNNNPLYICKDCLLIRLQGFDQIG